MTFLGLKLSGPCLFVVAVAQLLTLVASNCSHAQQADKMVLEGPALENCEVTFRYYKARQISKAVAVKITLLDGRVEEPIEGGFDGVEVLLQARIAPISVTLLGSDKELASEKLEKAGTVRVAAGKIGRVEFTPTELEPAKDEAAIFESLVKTINDQSTSYALVSPAENANIDFQCLDVFSREIKKRIGEIDSSLSAAGTIAWEEAGKRILAGVLYGQSGNCGIRLMISKGKLIDMQLNCPLLTDVYFVEPLDTEIYVRKAERLTKLLFAGDAKAAHQMYALQFQQQIKVEQLAKLSETLRQRYGDQLQSIALKKIQLLDYDFAKKSRQLQIDMVLETKSGSRCISRVVYSIPIDRSRVGKANLGAINVTQVFPSLLPKAAKITQELLEGFSKPLTAKSITDRMPAELAAVCDSEQLQGLLSRLTTILKDQKPTWDYDLWTVAQFQELTQVSGPVKFGDRDFFAELQFVGDDKLLGFSLYGPAIAESTMAMFDFPSSMSDAAQVFWTHLLSDQSEAAHAMLDKEFQSQFSLDELKKQLAEPETRPSKLKIVTVDSLRLSHQVARVEPLMATAFLTAEFEDGQKTQVACDLVLPKAGGTVAIYDFTNEFEIDFPVAGIPVNNQNRDGAELAIEAFLSASPEKMLELIDPQNGAAIDLAALRAYLENLKKIIGNATSPTSLARTVEYQLDSKRFRCNFELTCQSGDRLPIEVWFQGGFLERFVVSHPRIDDFVEQLKDRKGIQARVNKFLEAWFRDITETRGLLVASLQTEQALKGLNGLKEQFEAEHGKLVKHKIAKESLGERSGELEFQVTLQGERGEKTATLLIDVGAFGGLISGVTFQ